MHRLSRCLPAVLTALAAWTTAAPAAAGTVGVHLVSHHVPSASYNNFNPGLYYKLDEGPVAGFYRNSLRRTSVYAGYAWRYGRVDITTGVVTNYLRAVQPLLVPSVALFTHEGVTTRMAFIPRIEKRIGSHVLHVTLEY
jgi:hypothetical protein